MANRDLKATLFHRSVHLLEQDLLEASSSCPFCASVERIPTAKLQCSPDVVLLYCQNCHAASASRMPKEEALRKYYANYYETFGDCEDKITLDAPNRLAAHIMKIAGPALGDLNGRDISILDYGGGDGSISARVSKELVNRGAERVFINLIDYDKSAIEKSYGRIQIRRLDSLSQIDDKTVNLVIASAIIEHIPEPREILVKLLKSLAIGGVLYARTPYVAPFAKVAQVAKLPFDFTFPAHVHDLGAKFWNNIARTLSLRGCKVIRTTPSIVETSFRQHCFRTLAAYLLKIPGYFFKERYGFVGGWEIFIRRHDVD